jgi:hypothetical protein
MEWSTGEKNEIKTTVATLSSFPPQQTDISEQDVVVYFCESHNKDPQERDNIRAMSDLLHRHEMEVAQYEKYELRTGYLSRWNYMHKDIFDKEFRRSDRE